MIASLPAAEKENSCSQETTNIHTNETRPKMQLNTQIGDPTFQKTTAKADSISTTEILSNGKTTMSETTTEISEIPIREAAGTFTISRMATRGGIKAHQDRM